MEMPEIPKDVIELENKLRVLALLHRKLMKTAVGLNLLSQKKSEIIKKDPVIDSIINKIVRKDIEKLKTDIGKVIVYFAIKHPVYEKFFAQIKGMPPVFAGILLGFPPRASKISSYWYYCGLAPPSSYKRKDFNNLLKQALYVIGLQFLRVKNRYSEFYYSWKMEEAEKTKFKNYLTSKKEKIIIEFIIESNSLPVRYTEPEEINIVLLSRYIISPPKNKMHMHLRAWRKMMKMFIAHYYEKYWETFDIKVRKPYFVERGLKEYYLPPEELFDKNE